MCSKEPAFAILANRNLNLNKKGVAEGAGFEPAVGFPTFDFESSALNRTQPPFLEGVETSVFNNYKTVNTLRVFAAQGKTRGQNLTCRANLPMCAVFLLGRIASKI